MTQNELTRRDFLLGSAGMSFGILAGLKPVASQQATLKLARTAACEDDDDEPTASTTEGPYYTPNTPERSNFVEAGMAGTLFTLTGTVYDESCVPVANALVDLWHADDDGEYDNAGYTLRGHQFTDSQGNYTFETIVPGIYPGRTRHFHIKVQAPNGEILTTQLFWPGEPLNAGDGIYLDSLLMEVSDDGDGSQTGVFNFVVDTPDNVPLAVAMEQVSAESPPHSGALLAGATLMTAATALLLKQRERLNSQSTEKQDG